MKCKCSNNIYAVRIIPCCGDCYKNGAWDSEESEYVYDEKTINAKGLIRNQVHEEGECKMDTSFGNGCYLFTCIECKRKRILPLVEGC